MATLNRALTLAEIDDVAVRVGHHLNFDMSRFLNKFFDKDTVVAKAGARLAASALKTIATILLVPSHAHALATATGRRLDHHRIANVGADSNRMIGVDHHIGVTWYGANTSFFGNQFGSDFITHRLDGVLTGANKGNTSDVERIAKIGVFR